MKMVAKTMLAGALLVALLTACQRQAPDTGAAGQEGVPSLPEALAEEAVTEAPDLQDVIDINDRYVVGISYPPAVAKYPGLAQVVAEYAREARAELMEAVEAFGNDKPSVPYELSLDFETLLDSPRLMAVKAEGSRYTGGAHGQPLVARFVWLPREDRLLTAEALIPDSQGWQPVSAYAREQLHTQLSLRLEEEELSPEERTRRIRSADSMIRAGTKPEAESFAQFQPIVDRSGGITALRFVFPPYQVGPYSDGTQTVDVPAAVLLPHVASQYAELFVQ